MTEPLKVLREVVRYDMHAKYALRDPARYYLSRAEELTKAADIAARAGAARATHELLEKSAREAARAAVLLILAVQTLGSALDDDRDTLTDEEAERIRRARLDVEPEPSRRFDLPSDVLPDLIRRAADLVGLAVVDDAGHVEPPAVGRDEGGTSPVGGAAALVTPSADGPDRRTPTDTPPGPPSAGGVSVDRVVPYVERVSDELAAVSIDLTALARRRGPACDDSCTTDCGRCKGTERGRLLAQMQADLLALELTRRPYAPGRLARALIDAGWTR